MGTKSRLSNAERFGRWAGGMWRGIARRERQVAGWVMARGFPAGAATAVLWGVKLVVLGVLLYAAFWLALFLSIVVAAVWASRTNSPSSEDDYSFTTLDELRGSPGYDPNLYNDTSHERYEDD